MKYLIVGRSCVGKTTFAKELASHGLSIINTYTTRPKRDENDNDHIFITPDEAKTFTDRVAETRINGYEYFATRKQVEENDIYIIDPIGVYSLCENMPEEQFALIYIKANNETSRAFALKRGENSAKDTVYDARRASEDAEFTDFEKRLDNNQTIADNIVVSYQFENLFVKECITANADAIYKEHRKLKHTEQLIKEMLEKDRLRTDKDGNILCKIKDDDGNVEDVTSDIEHFASVILSRPDNFLPFINEWLSLYDPN